jgi:hypothetical protein
MVKAQYLKIRIAYLCIIISCTPKTHSQSETQGYAGQLLRKLDDKQYSQALKKAIKTHTLLDVIRIKNDKYGGKIVTFKTSLKAREVLRGNWMSRLISFLGPNAGWDGSVVRKYNPDHAYFISSGQKLGLSEVGPIYYIWFKDKSGHLPKALGFDIIASKLGVVEEVAIPNLNSLNGRIKELNKMLPNKYKMTLGFYPASDKVDGLFYVREFARTGRLPLADPIHDPVVFEHDYSVHIKQLIETSKKIKDTYQGLARDSDTLMTFLEKRGAKYSDITNDYVYRKRKIVSGSTTIPLDYQSNFLEVLITINSEVIDGEFSQIMPIDTKNPLDRKIWRDLTYKDKFQPVIELSFNELVHQVHSQTVNRLSKVKVYPGERNPIFEEMELEFAEIKKQFFNLHPELINKRYLEKDKTYLDLFGDSYEYFEGLKEAVKNNPI